MNRKTFWTIVLIAFFVGALGSIVIDRLVIPNLASINGLTWLGRLQSNTPIVITRREEVRLNEGVNLIELTKQAQNSVVSIYSTGANPRLLGNGLIITSDGVIFTTKEVLGGSGPVSVVTNDGSIHSGQVRAMDPKSPIAVVTIQASGLSVTQFSDSINMETAQRVFALGKTNQKFTREFVSGLVSKTTSNILDYERTLRTEAFEHSLKTDADINADYVGGPVVNLQGLVVGMVVGTNGQILPSEYIDGAVRTYLESGKISRPYIGLNYSVISNNLSKIRNLPSGGALVVSTEANSPAFRSGLLANDMILEVNGQKVEDSSLEHLLVKQGGNAIRLIVRRGTEQREITLTPEMR